MQRAGLAVAQLAMAIAPHARVIWIACGPGNNGGDGFEAARNLLRWGKSPIVSGLIDPKSLPADAKTSWLGALQDGVAFVDGTPTSYDLCIDALFGMGHSRPLEGRYRDWVELMNVGAAPVIAVDVPSGLNADTGACLSAHVKAQFTLSLLTLKPGLFTADGREACGELWFNSLGVSPSHSPTAVLSAPPRYVARAHNTHKGSYGDVAIIGGSSGMTGAAILSARAALHGGAGRVYVSMLDTDAPRLDVLQPELMFREASKLPLESMTVVAGCGGGDSIVAHLPDILSRSARLVLDADALNAIAKDTSLQDQLSSRSTNSTVLTPHPLEAARLLKLETRNVQTDRLAAAQSLSNRFACTVVLKGSGTVISAPGVIPHINPTGNARLASAGTGDVLAGMIGARWAAGYEATSSACAAVFHHGHIADTRPATTPLTAQDLIQAL